MKAWKARSKNARRSIIILVAAILIGYLFCLPRDLFKGTKYSTVIEDRNGELLGARIASDAQWRFPPSDEVPYKFKTAVIEFEDRWFAYHPGVNPVSIARAAIGNLKAGRVTSGGSTITMQVIRLSRGKERTLWQKLIEAVLATRLELRHSKKHILALYASHAPFGGNVVGLEAASWRYFGRPPEELSWGEAATLAVLPNAPAYIHPGKNRAKLLEKRNRLLNSLYERGKLDSLDLELALDEPLPMEPVALPRDARHLTEYYWKTSPGERVRTSVDIHLQRQVEEVTDQWNDEFSVTGINDLAAVVIDVKNGDVLAYVGNADPDRKRPGSDVDIVRSPRSTGSILKPVLYCSLLQDGEILPNTLLPDVPVNLNGFSPQNFNRQFAGAVPASDALARSLNVPSVHMLRKYGVPRFLDILRKAGLTTLTKSASHYGLSLILGGGEATLLDITSMYAKMSASYQSTRSSTKKDDWSKGFPLTDKCALWHTFEALKEVNRPDEMDWRLIGSLKKVAWKTGTSYGFRDAWAVGVTSDYAVGVWAGNAQGQGVPGLTGAKTAGPVMFEIFNLLPVKEEENAYASNGWFKEPAPGDYTLMEVCHESGHLAGLSCEHIDTLMLPAKGIKTDPCPYHKTLDGIKTFILPPSMEWYYRRNHPEYDPYIPANKEDYAPMEFIYPEGGATIYIPRQLDGSVAGITFNLAHRTPDRTVFWHLDNEFLGQTRFIHQMKMTPAPGKHSVTVVDDSGNSLSVGFTIAENKTESL